TNDRSSGYGSILSSYSGATTSWEWMTATGGTNYKFWDHTSTKIAAQPDLHSTWNLQNVHRINDTSMNLIQNGRVLETLTIANNQPSAFGIAIGANTAGTERLLGRMGESLIYDGISTDANNLISQYQSAKWGIALDP